MRSFIFVRIMIILAILNLFSNLRPVQQYVPYHETKISKSGDSNIELLDETGGTIDAVCGYGNIVYINEGSKLVIFDVSDPANPYTLAVTENLNGAISQLFYSDGIVYAISGINSLWMIDVTSPNDPLIVGKYESPWNISGIFVTEKIAYLTYFIIGINYDQSGLATVDVHDPANPSLLDALDLPVQGPMINTSNPFISGDFAYIAGMNAGFWIVDVTHANDLQSVIVKSGLNSVLSVAIKNQSGIETAYIGTGTDGLFIYNVNNPQSPQLLGSIYFNGWANDMFISGNVAYIAGGDTGLSIIDIHDSIHPVLIGNFNMPGIAKSLYVNNNVASVANYSEGFHLINVFDPSQIFEMYSFLSPSYSLQTYVADNLAYIADDQALFIFNAENPRSLKFCSRYAVKNLLSVLAMDGIAYLGTSEGTLIILDVEEPAQPRFIISIETNAGISDIKLYGEYLYLANKEAGLHIFDITDLANPVDKFEFKPEGWSSIEKIDMVGNTIYLTDWDFGVRIVDCEDPLQPIEIGHIDGFPTPYAISLKENIAFLATGSTGLEIIDVSNPQSPTNITTYSTLKSNLDVKVHENLAYLTDGNQITVLDISDITSPLKVGNYTSSNPIISLYRDKCVLYSAEWGGGFKSYIFIGGEETCKISGQIIIPEPNPGFEVIVHLSNILSISPDSNGFYSFEVPVVSSSDSYTLTVESSGHKFIPEIRHIILPPDATNQDFHVASFIFLPSIQS